MAEPGRVSDRKSGRPAVDPVEVAMVGVACRPSLRRLAPVLMRLVFTV